MIWAFEVASDDPAIARHIYTRALRSELLLRPIGSTVYFMPPYTISDDELALLVERTVDVVQAL